MRRVKPYKPENPEDTSRVTCREVTVAQQRSRAVRHGVADGTSPSRSQGESSPVIRWSSSQYAFTGLQIRKGVDSIQPALDESWEFLRQALVILNAALLVLAIDFLLIESVEYLN